SPCEDAIGAGIRSARHGVCMPSRHPLSSGCPTQEWPLSPSASTQESPPPPGVSFELLVDAMADYAIYMIDRDGRIISWNAGGEHIVGWRKDEILGRHFTLFYPPGEDANDRAERGLEIARETGRYEEQG